MKKLLLIVFAVITAFISFAQSPDQRTQATRIADLLAKMPAPNQTVLKNHANEIESMGKDGLIALIMRLSGYGKRDNTQIEYALGGFSYYISQPGQERLRKIGIEAYLESLNKLTDKDDKSFIIRQIGIIGTDDCVPVLAQFLNDDRLCGPAASALVSINSIAGSKALLDKMGETQGGDCVLSIVEGLGDLNFQPAVSNISELVNTGKKNLRKVALYALAKIGDPKSARVLQQAAEQAGFRYEPTGATSSLILFVNKLIELDNKNLAAKITKDLLKRSDGVIRIQALDLFVRLEGGKSAGVLSEIMTDPDIQYRAAALNLASVYNDPVSVALWLKTLEKSSPAVQAEIIGMLGKARAKSALPSITNLLGNKDQEVRLAAISSARILAESDVLPTLLGIMKKGGTQDIEGVKMALLVMSGDHVVDEIVKVFPTMPDSGKIALLQVLSARSARSGLQVTLSEIKDGSQDVRNAAYKALKDVVTENQLDVLFDLLNQSDGDHVSDVQDAVISGILQSSVQRKKHDIVLAEMKKVDSRLQVRYYKILAAIGGSEAVRVVTSGFEKGGDHKRAALEALSNWADSTSASALFKIGLAASPSDFDTLSVHAYVGIIGRWNYAPLQKYLMLREAMDIAKTHGQKKAVIRELRKTNSFPALLYTGRFLETPALRKVAAEAVMSMALSDKSFNGDLVRNLLTKCVGALEGPESEYQKTAINRYLTQMPIGEGFVPLFNGHDLSGWTASLAEGEKSAGKKVAKGAKSPGLPEEKMFGGWNVNDGELIYNGQGKRLSSTSEFQELEMFIDYKFSESNGPDNDLSGTWNNIHIVIKDNLVSIHQNGELIRENAALENYVDRSLSISFNGEISLHPQGVPMAFRDIYIRELPRNEKFVLSKEESEQGFKILFDGSDLDQWTGNKTGYLVENGTITLHPEIRGGCCNLYTQNEYGDFEFRFEFKLAPAGNNGVGIRAPTKGDAAYVGMEIQILDNDNEVYKDLHEYQYHGSVYGIIAAKRGYLKPTGEWNYEQIIAKGNRIQVILNGTVIVDGDIAEASRNGTLDGREHPGLKNKTGHIGFLYHETPIQFRRIRIKEL